MSASLNIGLTLALAVVGLALGSYVALGCSENLHPGTTRATVCRGLGFGGRGSELRYWLTLFAPAGLFVATQFVPLFRRHSWLVAGVIALMATAFWLPLIMIVSSNLLAD